jgi:ferredoxin
VSVKILIDEDVCMGHGRCYRLAPERLDCDDEGYVTPRGVPIEFPEDERDLAEEIVGTCPEQAITLIDD